MKKNYLIMFQTYIQLSEELQKVCYCKFQYWKYEKGHN